MKGPRPLTITRRLEIDAGHRLEKHESKCRNAHGHRYVFDVEFSPVHTLDSLGRVIDFSVIKSVLGGWLDHNWDHAFLYQSGDPIGEWLLANDQKCYSMSQAPTAEFIATYFLQVARGLMASYGIEVVSVRCWETPNCYAEAR